MTACARWVSAMLFHSLTHRLRGRARIRLQRRNVGRRIRRMSAQDVFKHPFASEDRRRPVGVRSHELYAAFSEQASTDVEIALERHAPKMRSVDVGYSVMRGQ